MSDHVDGPRSIGDPAGDLSDLFAFTSPEDAARTVLVLCVFPFAGASAIFSNAVNHSLVLRPVTVGGIGEAAKFQAGDPEYRFSCRFDTLDRGSDAANPIQRGTCTLPGGQDSSYCRQ